MNIPDEVIAAAIVPVGGCVVWAGRQFVYSVLAKKKRDERRPDHGITIEQFMPIADLLKRELNGRYMFASEAREKFAAIEAKIDDHAREMKVFITDRLGG